MEMPSFEMAAEILKHAKDHLAKYHNRSDFNRFHNGFVEFIRQQGIEILSVIRSWIVNYNKFRGGGVKPTLEVGHWLEIISFLLFGCNYLS